MGIKGFAGHLSEDDKNCLKSETWQKGRNIVKTEIVHFTYAPEIQHFAEVKISNNDNVYGVKWANLVRKYLMTAYSGEETQTEIISDDATYKVMDRGEVTAFYDADGNTLFDVENKRLKKEYEWLVNSDAENDADGKSDSVAEQMNEDPEAGEVLLMERAEEDAQDDVIRGNEEDSIPVRLRAEEKLKKEVAAAKDKSFADPVIRYLLERCREDEGLAEDVVQDHKTWQKCFDYIYRQARQQAQGNCAAVRDAVVYEWAEDYYHRDDKEEEKAEKNKTKKAKPATKRKATETRSSAINAEEVTAIQRTEALKESSKPRKNKDMDGQLDMFDLMGM